MDQHPVPRQITTFEFKLIGFMTLKQFIYLLVFVPLGYITYRAIPIPLINILFAFIVASIGFILAFVPFNDRPIDLMIKNLAKRLMSPTQYFFHKENKPLYFLQNLYFATDPHQTVAHIESREKLSEYLAKTQPQDHFEQNRNQKKQSILSLLLTPSTTVKSQGALHQSSKVQLKGATPLPEGLIGPQKPYVTGVVKNNKKTPLPGILIYIKDKSNIPLRLLKTNPHGVFATYNKLPPGDYTFEVKDPKGSFFFDTMKLHLENQARSPLEFVSKELL